MGIRKSYYRELQGGGVLFKLEKADTSWKNCKELNEEEVTVDCTEKESMGMERD